MYKERPTAEQLGRIAYDAYSAAAGGASLVTGDALPAWGKLPAPVQTSWMVAAEAVRHRVILSAD